MAGTVGGGPSLEVTLRLGDPLGGGPRLQVTLRLGEP